MHFKNKHFPNAYAIWSYDVLHGIRKPADECYVVLRFEEDGSLILKYDVGAITETHKGQVEGLNSWNIIGVSPKSATLVYHTLELVDNEFLIGTWVGHGESGKIEIELNERVISD